MIMWIVIIVLVIVLISLLVTKSRKKAEKVTEEQPVAQLSRRRTPLILTQAVFPSPITNCVGNRGNSLLLPR